MKRIFASACLLGQACRYDGTAKADPRVLALGETNALIPACPEVLGESQAEDPQIFRQSAP